MAPTREDCGERADEFPLYVPPLLRDVESGEPSSRARSRIAMLGTCLSVLVENGRPKYIFTLIE